MKLSVIGLNHKTAPVEVRERLAFEDRAVPEALCGLRSNGGFQEALILSTCNRVEVTVAGGDAADPRSAVLDFLCNLRHVDREQTSPHLYHYRDREAVRHLFRVAASLDSMVVGEPQILGQMKTAYSLASAHGGAGGFLGEVFCRAFGVAKRVRSQTGIGRSSVSVSTAAVELAREIFGSLAGKKVMLIGAGKMSELAARHIHASGSGQIFVTNRSNDRAEELAALFQGSVVSYDHFLSRLPEIDILIASSAAPHYVLHLEQVRRVLELRRNRPMFLIDIAVPRNIDPAVNDLDNVFLYDIDDLEKVIEANRHGRLEEAGQAEKIVDQEVERFMARMKAREAVPSIVLLQERLEQLRAAELHRVRGRLGDLTSEQEEAVDALTRSIIAKIAHAPIAELRRHAAEPYGSPVIDLIRRMFRLDE
jgi:glutamyl-tRNA reductase